MKGKKGSNTFSVRATDAAGKHRHATPATASWKVKKKKKKSSLRGVTNVREATFDALPARTG